MVTGYTLHGQNFPLDEHGFLADHRSWNPELASVIAAELEITLTDDHWPILHLLRELYTEYDLAPANRALVKVVGQRLGKDKGNSMYLMSLFGGSPARDAARIAGLPKPPHCL